MNTNELRCKQCRSLLAKHERDGLTIRRGTLLATVTGTNATVTITCYRCEAQNVLRAPPPATRAA